MDIEKLQNNIEKKGGLSKRDIILLFYLLHNPDYSYHIAKVFKEARTKNLWTISETKILSSANKLYRPLNKLVEMGILKKYIPKRRVGRPKKEVGIIQKGENKKKRIKIYYKVDPTFFQGWKIGVVEELVGRDYINFTFFLMERLSPSKLETIKYINKIKKFDVIALLLHIKKQLETVLDYRNCSLTKGEYREIVVRKDMISGKNISKTDTKHIVYDEKNCKAKQIEENSFLKVEDLLERMEKERFIEELKSFKITRVNQNTLEVNRNLSKILMDMIEFYSVCISLYIESERFCN